MAPTYKLTYFNLTALGEPIRFLFHYGGIEFTDNRFSVEEWPAIKPTMPFGQAPVLEIDGKMINQSNAIARYVAKLVKLAGKDDLQSMEIDAMVDNINDLRLKIAQYWYESDEQIKQKKLEPLVKETIPYFLKKFDAIAEENNGYFVGGELTWADMYFVGILKYLNKMVEYNLIEGYPNLTAVCDNVHSIPTIKKYLESRPDTDF